MNMLNGFVYNVHVVNYVALRELLPL